MTETAASTGGILGWVERQGNRLPDPVFIFIYLILALLGLSVLSAALGANATLSGEVLAGMPDF